ncbi:MAG: SUMF1/EgtB/PvdO family nonheme iron enzyme [Ignavibacteriae bacterium]|nr:SUMF1/EgtB/PvdO family nonheme iron enzyme [Ignavibacteriota bacterium]
MTPFRALSGALLCACAVLFSSCGSSDDNTTNPGNNTTVLEHVGSMVLIPSAGKSFSMGSGTGNADEKPVHSVTFSYSYWIDTTEVTQALYMSVMQAAHPSFQAPAWAAPYGVGSTHAAYLVEWDDAVLFCNARSKAAGLDTVYTYTGITGTPGNGCKLEGVTTRFTTNGYRLPTEAEWEYAYRAGGSSDFYWGKNATTGYPSSTSDSSEIHARAIWSGNAWNLNSDSPEFGVHRVASKLPNAYGLYDMSGNLWEWCHDWYDETYYTANPATDPTGPAAGSWHTLRGGSWGNDAAALRAAQRTFSVPDYVYYFIGFRTVRRK